MPHSYHFQQIITINIDDRCPAKKYYAQKFFNREKSKRIFDEHKETFDYLEEHTKQNFSRTNILKAIFTAKDTYDTLFSQVSENMNTY